MSKSELNAIEAKPAFLRQPAVKKLTTDNIAAFVEKKTQKPLPKAQQEAIEKLLTHDKKISQLAKLLGDFIDVYDHYDALAGLTPEETQKLHDLALIRKNFKDNHKQGEYDLAGFKNFIANEHKIVAFNKSMEWRQANITSLKKLTLWEDAGEIIVNSVNEKKLTPSELSNYLHQLSDIKFEWSRHQMFASFASETLLQFENDYIIPMEKALIAILNEYENLSPVIFDFLNDELYNLKELHKQAIYSMASRLGCTEKRDDIENDDILYNTIIKIENETGVDLRRNGKRPPPRKGLTAEIINNMILHINDFVAKNPENKVIADSISNYSVIAKPYNWQISGTDTVRQSILAKEAVIVYSANKIPTLIEQVLLQRNLAKAILVSEECHMGECILWRINRMLTISRSLIEHKRKSLNNKLDIQIVNDFNKWQEDYKKLIDGIYLRMSIEIKNTIAKSLDNIFSSEPLNHEYLANLSGYLASANHFNQCYQQPEYDPDKDIILAISMKLKQTIAKNIKIEDSMLTKMGRLLLVSNDLPNNMRLQELLTKLQSLAETVKNMHENDDHYILHFITHNIEFTLLTNQNIGTALKRHEYISKLYGKSWKETSADANEQLYNYIQLVTMPLLQECPCISLDNFDKNNTINNINQMEQQIQNQKRVIALPPGIHKQHEKEILKRINRLFDIKKYLFDVSKNNIDIRKLADLIKRVSRFFTETDFKETILDSIKIACGYLIKNYIIKCIETDVDPDFSLIDKINSILNINILKNLANDDDISKLLINYVEIYSGTNNHTGRLLVEFAENKHIKDQNVLYKFASKRLGYISSSKAICQQDYHFFNHYSNIPSIQDIYYHYQTIHKQSITEFISKITLWKRDQALITELFGNRNEIDAYRFKRVRELLSDKIIDNADYTESQALFDDFFSTINHDIKFKKLIVSPDNIIYDKTTLNKYLDYAANSKAWSPLLENIISVAGTQEQLQALHYRWFSKQLSICGNIETNEPGKYFKLISSQTSGKTSEIFITFMGEKNIYKLCAQVEAMLSKLQKINTLTSTTELSSDDYNLFMSMIKTLRNFEELYSLFSNIPEHVQTIKNLTELEHKIQLHQTLHTTIKKQTSLLSIASENATLHNLVLSLIKSVMDLEDSKYVTSENTAHYIRFCTDEVLDKINAALDDKNVKMTTPVLMTFIDLLSQLPSENLKLQLVNAHKESALTHPAWLMLINHIDDNKGILALTGFLSSITTQNELGTDFSELFMFSKKLIGMNKRVRLLLKKSLLDEAGIRSKQDIRLTFSSFATTEKITDKGLLDLWRITINKCNSEMSSQTNCDASLKYIVKQAVKTGDILLIRSRNNPALLAKMLGSFLILSDLYQKQHTDNLSLWSSPSFMANNILSPIINLAQRAVVIILLQIIEKFILKYVPEHKLETCRQISNDPVYLSGNDSIDKLSEALNKIINSHGDNKAAITLAYIMDLYHHTQQCLLTNGKPQTLLPAIDELTNAISDKSAMSALKPVKALLGNLTTTITDLNPLMKNDRHFANKPTWSNVFPCLSR